MYYPPPHNVNILRINCPLNYKSLQKFRPVKISVKWKIQLSNIKIKLVDFAELAAYWDICEPLIAVGLAPSDGESNAQHVYLELQAQRAHLIVGLNEMLSVVFALVVQFVPYPNYKVAHVYSIGGRGVIENAVHWASIKAWMKQHGAAKVQGVCKPSQARLWQKLGFTDTYHMVRQDL
jgi:hypothetical protein